MKDLKYNVLNVMRPGTKQIASRYDVFNATCEIQDINSACIELAAMAELKRTDVVLKDSFLVKGGEKAAVTLRVFPDIHSAERFAFRNYGKTRWYSGLVKSKLN